MGYFDGCDGGIGEEEEVFRVEEYGGDEMGG